MDTRKHTHQRYGRGRKKRARLALTPLAAVGVALVMRKVEQRSSSKEVLRRCAALFLAPLADSPSDCPARKSPQPLVSSFSEGLTLRTRTLRGTWGTVSTYNSIESTSEKQRVVSTRELSQEWLGNAGLHKDASRCKQKRQEAVDTICLKNI